MNRSKKGDGRLTDKETFGTTLSWVCGDVGSIDNDFLDKISSESHLMD